MLTSHRAAQSKVIIVVLCISALSVWSYVGGKIWLVASPPQIVTSEPSEISNTSATNIQSLHEDGRYYFADFTDPFLGDMLSESTDDDTAEAEKNRASDISQADDPSSVAERFNEVSQLKLRGIVDDTALLSTPDGELIIAIRGDSVAGGIVSMVGASSVIIRTNGEDQTIEYPRTDADRFTLAKH